MAKIIEKSAFEVFLKKGEEHEACGCDALANRHFNAAVTNYSIAIINYLDALSVNRFGKDLSSDNHEGAPHILSKSLNGVGIVDFRELASQCSEVLQLKNLASYRAEELTIKNAKQAQKIARATKTYVLNKVE